MHMIKILSHVLNIVFLTIAVYFAVAVGYSFLQVKLSTPISVMPGTAAASIATTPQKQPITFYQAVVDRNLFHTKADAEKTAEEKKDVAIETLEKTELRLKLWGTVATAGEGAYAVIESEKERKQNLYRVGDTVETATVKLILREKIIITVEGKDEILEIEKPVAAPPGAQPSKLAAIAPSDARTPFSDALSKRRITITRQQVESAMSNIGQLMGEAKIEPNLTEGNPDGLLITNVKPNSMFRRMGLRNGDVIIGVDGRPIQSVEDALKLYENLKTSDSASIEIRRRNRQQTIEYKIR